MSRLVVAALVLLVTVGSLFGAAVWNRGGELESVVLTERELALPHSWEDEGTGARLRLVWQPRHEPQDARLWLPDVTLREIGFTTGVPAGAPEAEYVYARSLPRLAWVAFELDGPAWKAILQQRSMTVTSRAEPQVTSPGNDSRLVPIDAAVSPEPLRRRYAGAPVIVLQAVIGMRYRNLRTEGPSVWAEVVSLVAPDVSIPARLRGRLPRTREGGAGPRYEVVLRVGRLGAMWVADLR